MKRSRTDASASKDASPLLALSHPAHHLTQTSLKDHFRVSKKAARSHAGKENSPDTPGAAVSPPGKALKPLPPGPKPTAAQPPAFGPFTFMPPPPAAAAAAPVMSECGISLSTAQFDAPAPSEDTAGGPGEITSKLPSCYGTAAGSMLLQRLTSAQQPHTSSTPDPDEILSSRPRSLQPAQPPRRTTSAATFSSGARGVQPVEYSTASLASWLPGKGNSSMEAAGCAAEESDCEDDAVSQRWTILPPAPAATAPPSPAFHTGRMAAQPQGPAAGSGGSRLAAAPVGTPAAIPCPLSGSEESEGGVIAGADSLPLVLELGQSGGAAHGARGQEAGSVRYHTRLEELLFGMSYVAPPATDVDDGAEE